MAIRFDELLDDNEAAVTNPRDIFLTLSRDKKFAFPRDIQTEVMKAWFGQRDNPDTVVKLNVGSGKTLVGLLLLQSSLNEGVRPAIYVCPDKQLVDQVLAEAGHSASMQQATRAIPPCKQERRLLSQ
jgi:replicative superfamily II helicase